jgi:2-keto-4-pentenoate hydratase/2-oxohepta-3-ene-1,7-dioic acid hydratase in catechol pathway
MSKKVLESTSQNYDLSKQVFYDPREVKFKAPIQKPSKVIVTGPSWKHHAEAGHMPDFTFVLKPPSAIIGPEEKIRIPRNAKRIVAEPELAIIVEKPGRYITQEDAWEHVAGFTLFNDVTECGEIDALHVWTRGKTYDTFATFGPYFVLKDQIDDVRNLALKLRVNGEERVNIRISEMAYPITHFITNISEVMTLEVGDVIATGTPRPEVPVKAGDSVEVEIKEIGILKNQFVSWKNYAPE